MSAFSSTVPQLRTTFLPQDVKMVSVLVGKEFGSNGHFYRFTHRIVHGDGIRFVPIIFNDGLYKVGMYKCHIEANEATAQQSPMPRWCMSAGSGRPKGYKVTGCSTH